MSKIGLNALVTKAILDNKFQEDIIHGPRQERVDEFNLSIHEKKAILAIEADNLEHFIYQLSQWIDEFETSHHVTEAKNYPILILDAEKILSSASIE